MGGYAKCKNGHEWYYRYSRGVTWKDQVCPTCGEMAIGTSRANDGTQRKGYRLIAEDKNEREEARLYVKDKGAE